MEQQFTPEQIQKAKLQALEALKNRATTYHVTVIDPTALPDKLKERKEISFVVKPPTLATLTDVAVVIESLPQSLFEETAMSVEAIKHLGSITEMIAILAHGDSKKDVPKWYVPFLTDNLTVEETLMIWHEAAMKLQTDFFLPFFQIAKQMNPMTMKMRN